MRLAHARLILAFLAVSLTWNLAYAQPDASRHDDINWLREELERKNSTLKSFDAELARLGGVMDAHRSGYLNAISAGNEYAIFKYAHFRWLDGNARAIFTWQIIVLYVISILTFALVSGAIFFSLRGLRKSLPSSAGGRAQTQAVLHLVDTVAKSDMDPDSKKGFVDTVLGDMKDKDTTLRINSTGIEVVTATSWVLVLVIAFGYLYLFVSEVMDIDEVSFGLPKGVESPASQANVQQAQTAQPSAVPTASNSTSYDGAETPVGSPDCSGEGCDPPGE